MNAVVVVIGMVDGGATETTSTTPTTAAHPPGTLTYPV